MIDWLKLECADNQLSIRYRYSLKIALLSKERGHHLSLYCTLWFILATTASLSKRSTMNFKKVCASCQWAVQIMELIVIIFYRFSCVLILCVPKNYVRLGSEGKQYIFHTSEMIRNVFLIRVEFIRNLRCCRKGNLQCHGLDNIVTDQRYLPRAGICKKFEITYFKFLEKYPARPTRNYISAKNFH